MGAHEFLLFYYTLYFGNLSVLMNQDLLPYCNFCTVFHCVDLSLSLFTGHFGWFPVFHLVCFSFLYEHIQILPRREVTESKGTYN